MYLCEVNSEMQQAHYKSVCEVNMRRMLKCDRKGAAANLTAAWDVRAAVQMVC